MQALRGGDILVALSDTLFMEKLAPALKQNGHEVKSCASAAEARSLVERIAFDVVLCGDALPDGLGHLVCSFIKGHTEYPELNRVSVALLSGDSGISEKVEVAAAGPVLPTAPRKGLKGLFGGGKTTDAASPPPPSAAESAVVSAGLQRSVAALQEAKAASFDDVIWKQMPMSEIVSRVQVLLRLKRYLDEISNAVSTLMGIAEGVEEQDKRARGHCKRLSLMLVELGALVGCDEWQLTALERGAYLHDVGKVSIPGALISKSEALTPREMEIIQGHCVLGETLCHPVAALKPVLPIIRHHHERSNGTGYPDGLRGEAIPILAQIFSIPDIYDALRMWRPYRMPMTEGQAVDVMRQEVNQGFWNRQIFEAFVSGVLPGLDERLDSNHVLWPPASLS